MTDRLSNQLRWCEDRRNGREWPFMVPYEQPIPPSPAGPFVYAIRCGEHTKIGIAKNVEQRLALLQTGCPEPLKIVDVIEAKDPLRIERRLHFEFRQYRTRGEWFTIPESILASAFAAERNALQRKG